MSLSQEQRKRLGEALSEWPKKTYLSWEKCGIGFLCQRAEVNIPPDAYKCPILFPQLENHYGLSVKILSVIFNTSLMFWLTAVKKSKRQLTALEGFLKDK